MRGGGAAANPQAPTPLTVTTHGSHTVPTQSPLHACTLLTGVCRTHTVCVCVCVCATGDVEGDSDEEVTEEAPLDDTPLAGLLQLLYDPACLVENKQQLIDVLLRQPSDGSGGSGGSGDAGSGGGSDDDGLAGCLWHERASKKDYRSTLGGDLNLERFIELLQRGRAFALHQTTAQTHWRVGDLEEEIDGKAGCAFRRLGELLRPVGRNSASHDLDTSRSPLPLSVL